MSTQALDATIPPGRGTGLWDDCQRMLEFVREDTGEKPSSSPSGAGPGLRFKCSRSCKNAKASPPPAESPAMTILEAGTGECKAPGGGYRKYK